MGSTDCRVDEPDAPGLFALVCDARTIAGKPETNRLTFVLFDGSVNDLVGTIEMNGRAGLNSWYRPMLATHQIRNLTRPSLSCSSSRMWPRTCCCVISKKGFGHTISNT